MKRVGRRSWEWRVGDVGSVERGGELRFILMERGDERETSPAQVAASASEHGGGADVCGGGVADEGEAAELAASASEHGGGADVCSRGFDRVKRALMV